MNYSPKCKKIPIEKLIITPMGMATPQCQTCIHKNCGNPIDTFQVSIMGTIKKWRLYNNHGTPLAVFDCEQYSPDTEPDKH